MDIYILIALLIIFLITQFIYYRIKIKKLILKSDQNINKKQNFKSKVENEFRKYNFLEHISHELRTPLNGIIGSIDLLKKNTISEKNQKNIEILEYSSKNLLYLINQLTGVSTVILNESKLSLEALNIKEVMLNLREIFYNKLNQELSCFFFISKNIPEIIKSDKMKIEQVLFEVIGNAFKYTKKGEITVALRCYKISKNTINLKIEIEDTGIGIKQENFKNIFIPFLNRNSFFEIAGNGLGIGLSCVKKILEFMNGTIEVKSGIKKGSKFTLTIPCELIKKNTELNIEEKQKSILFMSDTKLKVFIQEFLSEYNIEFDITDDLNDFIEIFDILKNEKVKKLILIIDEKYLLNPELLKILEKNSTSKLNIIFLSKNKIDQKFNFNFNELRLPLKQEMLEEVIFSSNIPIIQNENLTQETGLLKVAIVEDNKYNMEIAKQMMEHMEINLSCFNDGNSFLKGIEWNRFDLILLDIQLPDLNGFEILKKIRNKEATYGIINKSYIVALTANFIDGYKEKCLNSGFDSYLTKPFKMTDLENEINKVRKIENKFDEVLQNFELIEKTENSKNIDIENDPQLKKILLEVYDNDFLIMRDAYIKKDLETIEYFAHKLKGSFAMAQEIEISNIFEDVEKFPEKFDLKTIKFIENYMNGMREEIFSTF